MKAAVFLGEGRLEFKEIDIPRLTGQDQILVRVEAVSICGTDVHITRVPARYPAKPGTVLGHEFVGHVEKTGAQVTQLKIGDRVVVNPNLYCGKCAYCRRNLPNQCEHLEALGIEYDGAFANLCVVSERVAYKISESVSSGEAACAEPLACAMNGLKKVKVTPGDYALVIGGGPIGLMLAMLLRKNGAGQVLISEIAPYRIEFAKKLGFTVVNPAREDVCQRVMSETGIGADIVFDATGSQINAGIDCVRKGGDVVLFGVNKKSLSQVQQARITTGEITIHGTWLANATFPEAVRLLECRGIDVGALITDTIRIEQLPEALERLAAGEGMKVIVNFEEEQHEHTGI